MYSSPKSENVIYSPSFCSKPSWISVFCWTQSNMI